MGSACMETAITAKPQTAPAPAALDIAQKRATWYCLAAAVGSGFTASSGSLTASATNLLVTAATTQAQGIVEGTNFTPRVITLRPSSIVTYVQDAFTGANGALAGHTPDVGGSWVPGPAGLALLNGQLEGASFGDVRSSNSVTPPSV